MGRPVGSLVYAVNHAFFDRPRVLNCYWAGFLAADAALTPDRNNVRLGISTKDENHLQSFCDDVDFTGPIRYSNDLCVAEIYSVHWRRDLERHFHITPRKTFTLQPPEISITKHKMAFVAGYIDGDGYCGTYKNRQYDMPTISLLGTQTMTEWICNFVDEVCPPNTKRRIAKPFARKNVWQYSFYGQRANDFATMVRSMDIPFMTRKWNQV